MKTCLVVDDTPFDQTILGICATKVGLNVVVAPSGKDALGFFNTGWPDCVLLDWEMPGINGLELLKTIRQMERGKTLPVIICTSHENASFVGRAFDHGASGYIVKPINPSRLEDKLRELAVI